MSFEPGIGGRPAGRRGWRLLWSDRRGAVVILVALGLPIMIGFAGLGVETGLWYGKSLQAQAAADAAALSAAMEVAAGMDCDSYSEMALHSAAYNGFVPSDTRFPCLRDGGENCTSGAAYICVNYPPTTGPLAGDTEAAEVVVVHPQNAFLASLYLPSITIRTRSVARVSAAGTACVFALDAGVINQAIDITGSGTTTLSSCWLTANSRHNNAITIGSGASLTAESIWTVGSYKKTGAGTLTFEQVPVTNAYPITDTYAGISASATGTCTAFGPFTRTASAPSLPLSLTLTVSGTAPDIKSGMRVADLTNPTAIPSGTTVASAVQATGSTVLVTLSRTTAGIVNLGDSIQFTPATMSMSPGVVYCAPVVISSGTLTLSSGTYYIDGKDANGVAFSVTGGTVTGSGVTIVLTCSTDCSSNRAGKINITGGTVNLTAPLNPTSTVPAGVLFYQDKNASNVDTGINTIAFSSAGDCGSSGTICLTGAVYTPNTQINISGTSPGTCTILIGKKIAITAAATLASSGCPVRYTPPSVISQGLIE